MKRTPFFSILVPVCNQKGKMEKSLSSIRAQTFEDYEVVFVDDGSTDGSLEELREIAAGDARYSVVKHETNRSLLCARYTGMANAAGKYLFFLDSDDGIVPDALEAIYAQIMKEPADVIRFGFFIGGVNYELHPVETDDPFDAFMHGAMPPQIFKNCVSSKVAKKLVDEVEPFYCNWGEDTFMTGTVYCTAESFSRLDRCLYDYTYEGGMSRKKQSLSIEKLGRVLQSLDNCSEHLSRFVERHRPGYEADCRRTCGMMYKYEMCHFILNADDEKAAVEFLIRFRDDPYCDEYDYGCKEVLPEYFKRKLGIYPGDRYKFNAF